MTQPERPMTPFDYDDLGVYDYNYNTEPAVIFYDSLGGTQEALFSWTWEELRELCKKYEVDFKLIEHAINKRVHGTHTIYIDVVKHRTEFKRRHPADARALA